MKQDYLIAPSILSADFAQLGQEAQKVIQSGADIIHFDVMDNHYVPNLTVGPVVCQSLRDYGIKAPIDVHLMVDPVDSLVAPFAEAGASRMTFHPEASKHVDRTLALIKSFGCEAGLAFNPATPLSLMEHVIDKIDVILIMSVNPGFGGQSFIPGMLQKIQAAKTLVNDSGRPIRIEVDGGINIDNIKQVAESGADTFVAGSAIFNTSDYQSTISAMRAELAKVTS